MNCFLRIVCVVCWSLILSMNSLHGVFARCLVTLPTCVWIRCVTRVLKFPCLTILSAHSLQFLSINIFYFINFHIFSRSCAVDCAVVLVPFMAPVLSMNRCVPVRILCQFAMGFLPNTNLH